MISLDRVRRSPVVFVAALVAIGGTASFASCGQSIPDDILFTHANGIALSSTVDQITTIGYSRANLGAATYRYDPGITTQEAATHPNAVFTVADGRHFRLVDDRVELAMFGGIPDWQGFLDTSAGNRVVTTRGTDNELPLQRAMNYLHDHGGGVLRIVGQYGFDGKGGIIIPPDVSLAGVGPSASRLIRTSLNNTPVFLWGTYGPATREEVSITAEPRFSIRDAVEGAREVFTRRAADARYFTAGSLIFIEGGEKPGQGDVAIPNTMLEVVASDPKTGRIQISRPLDDDYVSIKGTPAAVRRLNHRTIPKTDRYTTDVTGRKWPLFVARGTSIKGIGFLQSSTVGWPTLYMSVYNFVVENVEMVGTYYWGFDPAAFGRISNTHWIYTNRALEAAYGTHDIAITDSSASLMPSAQPQDNAPLMWTNAAEGGKRLVLRRFTLTDHRQPGTPSANGQHNVAWALDDSSVEQVVSDVPHLGVGYFRGVDGVVENSRFMCGPTSVIGKLKGPPVQIIGSNFTNNIVRCSESSTNGMIKVSGDSHVYGNDF